MYNGQIFGFQVDMRPQRSRLACLVGLLFVLSLALLPACGPEKKAKTATVPVDTTIVDDDTLEVNDASKPEQTEHAR